MPHWQKSRSLYLKLLPHISKFLGQKNTFSPLVADMEFVKDFTPSDFQEKNFTLSISPNFNIFSKKKHKKWVKMDKFTPLAKILHTAGTDGMDKFHLWMKCVCLSVFLNHFALFLSVVLMIMTNRKLGLCRCWLYITYWYIFIDYLL